MNTISGKALLIIEKMDSRWVPFKVHACIQSASGGLTGREAADEDFGLLDTNSAPLPSAAYKMKTGERIWVAVSYTFEYHHDYWGEWDMDLYYRKQRVIKRRVHTCSGTP